MDTPRIRSRTFAGVLACAFTGPLLVLGACGGGDDSVADPPISSSPSSSSPTSAPHRETPEHFIRRWTQAEKKMENTGQTDEYLALSRRCAACQKLARTIRTYYSAGGFVKWGGWRILSIQVHAKRLHATTYAVRNRSLPTTYKKSAGAPIQHFSGGITIELLQLERDQGAWNLTYKAELAS